MSKSKNNGVDPQSLIDQYGADTARLFVMFASPPEQTLEWSGTGVEGAQRFLRRVWASAHVHHEAVRAAGPLDASALDDAQKALRREIHTILRQADYDYQRKQYNTVVSAAMKMLNAIEGASLSDAPAGAAVLREALSILVRVLYPVVPHLGHALWRELGLDAEHGDLLDAPWPQVDEAALVQDEIELVLQINGKVRGAVRVAAQADQAAIQAAATATEAWARHAEGRTPRALEIFHVVEDLSPGGDDRRDGCIVPGERVGLRRLLGLDLASNRDDHRRVANVVPSVPEGGRVGVHASLANGSAEIAVTDTGIGIAEEDQARIFEEFQQAGPDHAGKREGTGLGLTLTRKFVELHGGSIWVKSRVGQGSTFTFALPVRPWPTS